jgi:aspartate carbamoyltransferase catalytic subunit
MKNRSLVSIEDYSKDEIFKILELAEHFEQNPNQKILDGKVIASLFFEPSTRTRLSFESAVNKLGGRIIGFSEAGSSSVSKGESLKDTILTVSKYSDFYYILFLLPLHIFFFNYLLNHVVFIFRNIIFFNTSIKSWR